MYCADGSVDPGSNDPPAAEPDEVHGEVKCNKLILVTSIVCLMLYCMDLLFVGKVFYERYKLLKLTKFEP